MIGCRIMKQKQYQGFSMIGIIAFIAIVLIVIIVLASKKNTLSPSNQPSTGTSSKDGQKNTTAPTINPLFLQQQEEQRRQQQLQQNAAQQQLQQQQLQQQQWMYQRP